MRVPVGIVFLSSFLMFALTPLLNAQCGQTQTCVTSFTISPSTIPGDNAQTAVASASATLAQGETQWIFELKGAQSQGVSWKCDSGQYAAPNGGGYGFAGGCYVSGSSVSVELYGANYSGTPATAQITGDAAYNNDTGILQQLTLNPVPNPYESPSQDPDSPSPPKSCPNCQAGAPINVTNGDVFIPQQDYYMPGLAGGFKLVRTWNSLWPLKQGPEEVGIFGDSWRSNYEERIVVQTGGVATYWKGNGSFLSYSYAGSGQYTLVSPPNDQTTMSFNSDTSLFTVTEQNGTQRIFNNAGYLISIVDLNGNTITINVDATNQNRISSIVDASGNTLTFNYGNPSYPRLCTSIADAVGTFATYTYDYTSGRLTQVQYPDGSQYNFQYNDPNASTLISLVTDSAGKTIEAHTYDFLLRGITSQQGNDSNGSPVNKVTVTYGYPEPWENDICNSVGSCTILAISNIANRHFGVSASSADYPCATCAFAANYSTTISGKGYTTSYTDAANNETQYSYDGAGNTLSKGQPEGNTFVGMTGQDIWSYTYNQWGEETSVTDPLGQTQPNHTTYYGYDGHGNLISVTTPSPDGTKPAGVTQFTPNAQGQTTQITDPLSNVTTIAYCTQGQANCPFGLVSYIKDAQNNTTTYTYDGRGNRLTVTDALSDVTQFQYDSMNRVTQITYPTTPATTVQFHYDWRGRRDYVIDQNGNKTSYTYDDADRLISVTDAQSPTAGVTRYGYDTENNLTDVYDADGNHTETVYDGPAPLYTVFPSGERETYNYDAQGRLDIKTDRNGVRTCYYHDYQNRVWLRFWCDLGGEVQYTFDAAGRVTEVQDTRSGYNGTYSFNYDNMNRLTSAITYYGFASLGNQTVSYGYDAASNRTSMTDPQGGVTTYGYDSLNRLNSLSYGGQNFNFGYDALSRRTSLTRPNGVDTSYTYDPVSRLLSVLHQAGATILDGASYRYDSAGNRTSKTDERTGVTSSYSYDNIYQLKQVTQAGSTTESYTYDLVGNRLSSLGVSSYQYNASNELTSLPSGSYSYDNNGNTLQKPDGTQLTWDADNELQQVTLPGTGGTVNFKYDPFGRRTQKAFTQNGTTTTTNYIYDGMDIVEEIDLSGNVLARYTRSPGIDDPLSQLRSGTTSYFHQDGLGSVTSLSSGAGTLANTYAYDSFGNLSVSNATITNPFQYTGREFDQETGMYYYRARHYDESIGRFLSEDPLRSSVRTNAYKYVSNSPLLFTDPLGLTETCTSAGIHQLTPWITYKTERAPLSGWTLTWSGETGGPDQDSMVPFAILNCRWSRLESKTTWSTALFELTWKCVDQAPCGVVHQRMKYDFEWSSQSSTTNDTENNVRSIAPFMGTDSDLLDDYYCMLYGP